MERIKNNMPAKKSSKDLLGLENKSPYPDSFLIKTEKKPEGKDGPRKTFAMPKSSVLEAAKAFLPKMAEANESIADMTPEEVNFENVDSDEEHVEMNLAMFEYESNESSSEEETDDEVHDLGGVNESNFHVEKPERRHKRPVIEVLDSSQSDKKS